MCWASYLVDWIWMVAQRVRNFQTKSILLLLGTGTVFLLIRNSMQSSRHTDWKLTQSGTKKNPLICANTDNMSSGSFTVVWFNTNPCAQYVCGIRQAVQRGRCRRGIESEREGEEKNYHGMMFGTNIIRGFMAGRLLVWFHFGAETTSDQTYWKGVHL